MAMVSVWVPFGVSVNFITLRSCKKRLLDRRISCFERSCQNYNWLACYLLDYAENKINMAHAVGE